jgi:hypothetical protein
MRIFLRVFVLLLVAGLGASAQDAAPISTNQLTFPFPTVGVPIAPQPLGAAAVTGTPTAGNFFNYTYYFWLVSEFTLGNSAPSKAIPCYNAPQTLSGSNYCSFSWQAVPGANSYDVLMTTSPQAPGGTGNYAVTTGITSTSISVQSNSLSSYTVNTFVPASYGLSLTNEGTAANTTHLILRQQPSGAFLADLTSGGGMSPAFGSLTSGTNTGMAGVCGSGCSLGTSGTGTLTANAATASSAIAQKPVNSNAICYASPQGNDSNDGLSWGTSKLTVYGCIIALPNGSSSGPVAGNGTIYVANNTAAHPTSTCGIWIMGSTDPNYSSPPACWLKESTYGLLDIIGVAANVNVTSFGTPPQAVITGGSSADNNHPLIWLSNTLDSIKFSNLIASGQGHPIVVGENSNLVRSGTYGPTANIFFDNVSGQSSGASGQGPSWDITGWSFGVYFTRCAGVGSQSVNGTSANIAAAFLFDSSADVEGAGVYLITMRDTSTLYGPIIVDNDPYGINSIELEGVWSENQLGSSGAVWFTGDGAELATVSYVGVYDNSGAVYAVENDTASSYISVRDLQDQYTKGVMQLSNAGPPFATVESPLRAGQSGVLGGYNGLIPTAKLVGNTDAARRLFGPAAVRFTNLATLPSSVSGGTITTGVTAPDGTTGAITISSTGTASAVLASQSLASATVNSWYISGAWIRATTANGYYGGIQPLNVNVTGGNAISNAPNLAGICTPLYVGDTEWEWVTCVNQLVTATGSGTITLVANVDATPTTLSVYGPVFLVIPASAPISANEAYEIGNNLSSYSSCLVGTLCTMSGTAVTANSPTSLTDASTVTWNLGNAYMNASWTFTVHSGSRTLDITNPVAGGTYILRLVQDGTGGEGLTLGTGCTWKVSNGGSGAVTLSTSANAIDILSFYYDGTNCYANLNKNFN